MLYLQRYAHQLTTHEAQPPAPPPTMLSDKEVFYTSGTLAGLLLFHAIIAQATRFVRACKD